MAFIEKTNFNIRKPTFFEDGFDDYPKGFSDLCERATQLGLNFEENIQWTQNSIKRMNALLDDVYFELQPSQADRKEREYVIQFLDSVVRRRIPGSRIVAFGSYVMDMFTSRSDLDLSLMIGDEDYSRDDKLRFLKRLRKSLYQLENDQKTISKIQAVMRATVPVVKFVVSRTGTECDISVENKDGVLKSTLLWIFSSMDVRFRQLCFLLKHWAKAQDVNQPKDGTLSSFAIILLVAFHLQTRSPPIFPPFCVFLEGLDLKATPSMFSEVERRVEMFKRRNPGRINTESVSQLFATFFAKLVAVEDMWQQGLCASAYKGGWITKYWANNTTGIISVEDFTDRSQNSARAVSRKEFDRIYHCFKTSLAVIQKPLINKHDSDELMGVLFVSHVTPGKRRSEERLLFSREKQQKLDPAASRLLQQPADLDDFPERARMTSVSRGSMQRQVEHISMLRQEQLHYQQPPVPYITNHLQSFSLQGQAFHVPHYLKPQHVVLVPSGIEQLPDRSYVPAAVGPQIGFPSNEYALSQKVFVPEHVEYDANRYAHPYHHPHTQVQPWLNRKSHMGNWRRI
ncbi:hypothetical protein O6H91_03G025500 [Diphasiastrum complanatum]|uniref:Uncharacterized protein n=1 Tax=Diphasiastrum complanatum TaxID=34168 RepID=A0ACC2E550_DIPCM|nr:hypothetical protein O6H91_03G025500 [Diphasiastrum complanatum]